MYYTVIQHSGYLRILEHSLAARVFYISQVFSQIPVVFSDSVIQWLWLLLKKHKIMVQVKQCTKEQKEVHVDAVGTRSKWIAMVYNLTSVAGCSSEL